MKRRKHLRKRKLRKKNLKIIIPSLIILLSLAIGYGAFQSNISLNVTGRIKEYEIGRVWNFDYTGSSQTFKVPQNGTYKIELWGAEGGRSNNYDSGKGAYTSGEIRLSKNQKIFIYVGQKGYIVRSDGTGNGNQIPSETINIFGGGGNGNYNCLRHDGTGHNYSGGGATDIRLNSGNWDEFTSLKSRIMVAAGAGGVGSLTSGSSSHGGSINGIDGKDDSRIIEGGMYYERRTDKESNYYGTGGTQTSGGNINASFGKGGDAIYSGNICNVNSGAGGGGGYYGGGASSTQDAFTSATGGGGSSFISGYEGCDAISEQSTENNIIHTGQSVHYSGYKFDNGIMKAGNEEMPTHSGIGTIIGNEGNGYAKITLISKSN